MSWQWHQLEHMVCKSYASRSRQLAMPVPHHSVFTGRMLFLPPNQKRQSTEGKVMAIINSKSTRMCICAQFTSYITKLVLSLYAMMNSSSKSSKICNTLVSNGV